MPSRRSPFPSPPALAGCRPLLSGWELLAAAPSASPADIRDIVAPQPFHLAASPWLLVLAVTSLLSAGLLGWLLFSNLRQPKPVLLPTPRDTAEARLARLRSRLDETDARVFGAEAADILRAFIGAQYALRAERQTSPEFLEAIRGWPFFSVVQHTILQEFLTECDLLKFARQDATREGKGRLLEQVAQFLAAEPPTLAAGTTAVSRPTLTPVSAPPLPPPLPGTWTAAEPTDARYMPPDLRQATLPPAEPAGAGTPP